MVHHVGDSRDRLLHLAQCAAQLSEAAAIAVERGGDAGLDLPAAIRSIRGMHECHVDAAIIILARALWQQGISVDEWRDEIPRVFAAIASGPTP